MDNWKWYEKPMVMAAVQCNYGENSYDIMKNHVLAKDFNGEQLLHLNATGHVSSYDENRDGKKLDAYLKAAHESGLREILYWNVHCVYEETIQIHPEWKQKFKNGDFEFFEIDTHASESLIHHLSQTFGAEKVPKSVWQKDLLHLPSPIRSSDCIGVYTSGPIPSCLVSVGDTTLDIIRKESKLAIGEPPFNCYFHYIIKNSDGSLYISRPLWPDHHWAIAEDIKREYNNKFSKETNNI